MNTILITLLAALAMSMGCENSPAVREGVLAVVGDAILTDEMVDERFALSGKISPSVRREFISRWVNRELLYQEARALGYFKDPQIRYELNHVERDLLIQKILDQRVNQKVQVTEDEISGYYRDHLDTYKSSDDLFKYFHVKAVSLSEAQSIDAFIKQLSRLPEPSDSLRAANPAITSNVNNFMPARLLQPDIVKILERLEPGTISPRTRLSDGYHYVQLIEKRAKGVPLPLNEVRSQIEAVLVAGKRDQLYRRLIDELRDNVKVEIYENGYRVAVPDTATGL